MEEERKLNFHSESLQAIIDKHIYKFNKYKGYEALLSEIFQRRAKEYGYTDEEMEKQIETFVGNVHRIIFIPEDVYYPKNSSAHYHPATAQIAFRKEYFEEIRNSSIDNSKFDAGEYFFELLTHEVYHAISHKNPNEIGLSQRKPFGIVDTVINEAFTEVAASRTVYRRNENDFKKQNKKVTGYYDIAFVPGLIANIIGESEKTVLKAGMDGSDALENLILSKYPKELHKDVKTAFNKFKFYLDAYHRHSDKPLERISDRDKNVIEKSLIEMENVAEELFFTQVKNDLRACDMDFAAEINFRFNGIYNPFGNSLKDLLDNKIMENSNWSKINDATKDKRKRMIDVLKCLETAAIARDDISDKAAIQEVDRLAKSGELLDNLPNVNKRYGLNIISFDENIKKAYEEGKEVVTFPKESKYRTMIISEDFHDFAPWDNTFESIETMKIFNKKSKQFNLYKVAGAIVKGVKGVAKGVTGIFKRILNRKDDDTKLLPDGDDIDTDTFNARTLEDEIKVDPSTIDFKPNSKTIDVKKINMIDNTRNEGH